MYHIDYSITFSFSGLQVRPDAMVHGSGQALIWHSDDGRWLDTTDMYWDGTDAGLTLQAINPNSEDARFLRDALQLHHADEIAERIASNLADLREERRRPRVLIAAE